MATKLVFTSDSVLDTTLVDERTGAVVYEVETVRRFFNVKTVVRRYYTSAYFSPPIFTYF